MRYFIVHRTLYDYASPVTVCHYMARLAPRSMPGQECPWHELKIQPDPSERASRTDSFGNNCLYFEISGSHLKLEVIARSFVDVHPSPQVDPATTPAWETLREACVKGSCPSALTASQYLHPSSLIQPGAIFADYAAPSFPPLRPVLEGLIDLNHRIHREFTFDPTATDVATPLHEVMKLRRGVCQDFAQVMIACLRSIGLPARYVSGYLETKPPEGQARLIGADASHAWASLYCGDAIGWMDADPTNDILPSDRHITVAWGRDFQDVSPLRGVTLGTGEQVLTVGVDVIPEEEV
jgi:transglutaminase-like putative cysteine protease